MRPVPIIIWQYETITISGKTVEKIKDLFGGLHKKVENVRKGLKDALQANIDLAKYIEKNIDI